MVQQNGHGHDKTNSVYDETRQCSIMFHSMSSISDEHMSTLF